jgi:hypothetical protein
LREPGKESPFGVDPNIEFDMFYLECRTLRLDLAARTHRHRRDRRFALLGKCRGTQENQSGSQQLIDATPPHPI